MGAEPLAVRTMVPGKCIVAGYSELEHEIWVLRSQGGSQRNVAPAHRCSRLADRMDHSKTVSAEFARQAEAFAQAGELRAPEVTLPIIEVLKDLAVERILDLACGPCGLTPMLCQRARLHGATHTTRHAATQS